jgi:anti-sigma regulatory factor (Ser/Thr protein kinase)
MKPVDLPPRDGGSPGGAEEQESSARLCAYHAHTPGDAPQGPPSRPAFPVTSAATARAYVLAVLRGQGDTASPQPTEQAVTDLLLVTSELVSNAIRHGGGLVAFDATPARRGVRIVVHDRSPDVPSAAFGSGELPAGGNGGGFGWPLIIKLTREIVIERCADGKAISVLVPLDEGPAEPPSR